MSLSIKKAPKTGTYQHAGKFQIWDGKTFLGSRDTENSAIKLKKQFEDLKPSNSSKSKYKTVSEKKKYYEGLGWKISSNLGYVNEIQEVVSYSASKGKTKIKEKSLTALFKKM